MAVSNRNLGILLLAIYLILTGIISMADMSLGRLSIAMPLLALSSGVLLLIGK